MKWALSACDFIFLNKILFFSRFRKEYVTLFIIKTNYLT